MTMHQFVYRKIKDAAKCKILFLFKDTLKQIYEDPKHEASFSNPRKLFNAVKDKHISKKTVKTFLESQDSYTKHRQAKYKYARRIVTSPTINFRWQGDLMVLDKIYRQNYFYKYILILVDVLSRYAYAIPLKTKSGPEVAKAFDELFSKVKCKFLQVDLGTEFHNRHVKVIMKKHNVEMYSTYSNVKACIAERFVRTLREKIYKYLVHNRTKSYISSLQDIVDSYNSSVHSRTKLRPRDTCFQNQMVAWHNSFDKQLQRKSKIRFKLHDYVRILINKKVFEKSTSQTFSNTVYQIQEVVNSVPVTYKLKDTNGQVVGSFYNEELCKVTV